MQATPRIARYQSRAILQFSRSGWKGNPALVPYTKAGRVGCGVICSAIAPCSLGAVRVTVSPQGICSIALGDDPDVLAAGSPLPRADGSLAGVLSAVQHCIEAPGEPTDLVLDLVGTPFQIRVWEALRSVPAGSTVSYGELAGRVGQPGAARAVARACASNPCAIVVPCHRVTCADGSLGGYRWGIARKAELIRREGVRPAG